MTHVTVETLLSTRDKCSVSDSELTTFFRDSKSQENVGLDGIDSNCTDANAGNQSQSLKT